MPTRRDCHLQVIAEKGRMAWQKASRYNARAWVEAAISRYKRLLGDGLHSRTERRRAVDVEVGVHALNRMLELGSGISEDKLPDYLGFFQFVHNARRRGKALLGTLISALVAGPD